MTADCECPTCWSLMKDQRTCAPSVDESLLTCKSEGIDIGLRTVFTFRGRFSNTLSKIIEKTHEVHAQLKMEKCLI